MALNLTHQIGALCGTAITAGDQTTTDQPAPSSATAMWRPIPPSTNLLCRIQRPGAPDLDPLSPPASPIKSPLIRPDLDVACQALVAPGAAAEESAEDVKEYSAGESRIRARGVPVFVMLPLDTVKVGGGLNRRKAMNASLMALKSARVEGIMVDVWWGLVEKDGPGAYNWAGYKELMDMCGRIGLKVQAVMSFHQCGGNVGDSCT